MTKEEFINHINKNNEYFASELDTWCFILRSCEGKMKTAMKIVKNSYSRFGGKGIIDAEQIYNQLGRNHLKHLEKFNIYEQS